VRDLGSRNGLRVNNAPVTEKILVPGDVVQVAHLSLRFVDEAESVTPPPRPSPAFAAAAPVEDDRTRAVPASARSAVTAAHTMPMPVTMKPTWFTML